MTASMENRIALLLVWLFAALCGVSAFVISAVLFRALRPIIHNLTVAWATLAGF